MIPLYFATLESMTNNPLDDTQLGRIAQAVCVGLVTSTPDYIKSPILRGAVNTAILGAGLGVIAYANAQDDDPDNDVDVLIARAREQVEAQQEIEAGPLATWGVIAAVIAAIWGVFKLDAAINKRIAGWLRRRGVSRPHSLMGLFAAGVLYASSTLEPRVANK